MRLGLALFALLMTLGKLAAQPVAYPSFELSGPFKPPKVLERLYQLFPELPTTTADYLRTVEVLGYDFPFVGKCPFPRPNLLCVEDDDQQYYFLSRRMQTNLDSLPGIVQGQLNNHEIHGCSSLTFRNLRRILLTDRRIQYMADFGATKRWCFHDLLGGYHKVDVAHGSGRVVINVDLTLEDPDPAVGGKTGSFKLTANGTGIVDDADILGFIDTDSLVGQIIGAWAKVKGFIWDKATFQTLEIFGDLRQGFETSNYSVSVFYNAARENDATLTARKFYSDFAATISSDPIQFIDVPLTKFTPLSDGRPSLLVVSKALVAESALPLYHAFKDFELKYISSLGKNPVSHEIRKGESLWEICRREYGFGDAYFAIAGKNRLMPGRFSIKAGQTLILPPLFELVRDQDLYVKPGDTYWGRFTARYGLSAWPPKTATPPSGSNSIRRIFPGQVIGL